MKFKLLKSWALAQLSKLGYENPEEIVSYLLQIDESSVVEDYLHNMLDASIPVQKHFIKEFLKRFTEAQASLGPGLYRKPDIEDSYQYDGPKSSKCKEKVTALTLENVAINNPTKKKTKFVSLYSEEGLKKDVITLPGRHKCDCQATKHKLINNCLKCGRIVCEQEGSGPCAFCQTLVISKEEKEVINRGTKKSEALHNKLINSKKITDKDSNSRPQSNAYQKAIDHKNKLLDFDKTSEKRTKVFDDENDYFQSDSKWIKAEDREKLQQFEKEMKAKKYDRNNQKYTIDLLGRKTITEKELIYDPNDPALREILNTDEPDIYSYGKNEEVFKALNLPWPTYIEENRANVSLKQASLNTGMHRLQDKELQEMRDEGLCLSMHQPWASLLIAGIKVHEGRNWYHSHRGRLWIASAAKPPTPVEISQVEQMYRILLKKVNIKFPMNYPTGCLLGCIDVIDVLPQEEYRRQFKQGESDSPYVFVCENPQEMIIKFPIKGQHKIYKIDSKIHLAAQKSLIMT